MPANSIDLKGLINKFIVGLLENRYIYENFYLSYFPIYLGKIRNPPAPCATDGISIIIDRDKYPETIERIFNLTGQRTYGIAFVTNYQLLIHELLHILMRHTVIYKDIQKLFELNKFAANWKLIFNYIFDAQINHMIRAALAKSSTMVIDIGQALPKLVNFGVQPETVMAMLFFEDIKLNIFNTTSEMLCRYMLKIFLQRVKHVRLPPDMDEIEAKRIANQILKKIKEEAGDKSRITSFLQSPEVLMNFILDSYTKLSEAREANPEITVAEALFPIMVGPGGLPPGGEEYYGGYGGGTKEWSEESTLPPIDIEPPDMDKEEKISGVANEKELEEFEKRGYVDFTKKINEIIEKARALEEIYQKSAGTSPGMSHREVNDIIYINVRQWLRSLVSSLRIFFGSMIQYTWARVHRKLPGIFPGYEEVGGIRVRVLLDTSGSIGPEELRLFAGVVYGVAKEYDAEVIVYPWDAKAYTPIKIMGPHDVKKIKTGLYGGGGTVIGPVLELVLSETKEPNVEGVIILSDWIIEDLEKPDTMKKLETICKKFAQILFVTTVEQPPKLPRARILNIRGLLKK